MIGLITRFLFMTAGLLGGYAVSQLIDWEQEIGLSGYYVIIIFIILGWSFGYLLGGIVGRELTSAWSKAEDRIRDLEPTDLVLGTAGLVVGLLAALLFSQPLRLIQPTWLGVVSTIGLSSLLAYIGVRASLVKRREFAAFFPRATEEEEGAKPAQPTLLDTSAVIDGRFVELQRLGFLPDALRVPRFVLAELQTLADSADDTRRARGRRGLDLLDTLSSDGVEVFEIDYPDIADVDHKLLRLAAETGGALVTVDHNLTKVARVSGVDVRNLHELATSMRPSFLPGDTIRLRVLKQGKEPDQGVGYLEDGTMVVVQDGKGAIGADVDAAVTSVLQTSAGRMVFARLPREAAETQAPEAATA